MKQLLTSALILLFSFARAQVNEHFSDGNFSSDIVWNGDDSLFRVNTNLQLQSKGTPGTSKDISLSTASNFMDSAEWQCWVRFNLSPSTQNFCRFYIVSDQPDLKGSLNGYYVQFGGVTGNTDSITLYRQKGTTHKRVFAGRPATVSKSNNIVRIKVLRDQNGNWQLFSDTLGGTHFIQEGSGNDNEFTASNYCGYFVRFTTSNVSNYFLDDVYAGPMIIDHIPPSVDTVNFLNATTLRVKFSENMDSATALDPTNYVINDGIGIAISAQFENENDSVVILHFQNLFTNGTQFTLTVFGVKDLYNNTLIAQKISFNFFIPQKEDILISEFFPDPTPPLGLPQEEFIEVYNRSDFTINLSGWTLSDGTTTATISNVDIKPDSFIIFCASTNSSLFSGFGKTVGISNFPSLNNSGDLILLKDKIGNIIHELKYDMSWYADQTKENGGWTIEMKNPFDLCKGKNNFSASVDGSGGTPGRQNSAWSKLPDTVPPKIDVVNAISSGKIILTFNENMDSASLMNASISISNGINCTTKNIKDEFFDSLELQVTPLLSGNIFYTLTVNNAKDCDQNLIDSNSSKNFIYYLPDTARSFDVVMDEILADPDPAVGLPAYEFIELYNKSTRIISLKDWTIEDAVSKTKLPDIILLPDSFLIVTSVNGNNLFSRFGTSIGITNFPSLGNDGDELILKNDKEQVIHAINYSSDWYDDNVKKTGGWSLEMIDAQNPCAGKNNWSASKSSNGGTPGKRNSVNAINRDHTAPKLVKAYLLNSNEVNLAFNETLDSAEVLSSAKINVNPFGTPQSILLQPFFYTSVIAQFNDSFQTKNTYRILADGLKDCAGNTISEDDYADFGLPENADSGDVAINEILFNPGSGGIDFVELYNRSDKVIDLKKLFIANANDDNSIKDLYQIATEGFLLFPKNYCALSENSEVLKQQYFSPNTKNFIQCTMPSFPDNAGITVIVDATGKRYDQFSYDDQMHFPLLDNKEGVSLERIDFNRPTSDRTNWTSAATSVFATPAYRNSQFADGNANGDHLHVEPEVFSPDGDGYKDVVNISYTFDQGGFTGNIFLYDSRGEKVRQLLYNGILGTSGTCSWNGITDKKEKAAIGIYMVYFEVFNLNGEVKNYKSTVVVGGKL